MELAIDIVKSILLPKLEKDTNFDSNKTDATFWESFAIALLDFKKDDTKCKTAIYSLELNNPERIISKLPNIYNTYVKELAENYVLGNESEAIESLLKANNQVFEEEVRFLSNLENVIIDMERQRIIEELPTAYESLDKELNKKKPIVIPLWIKYAAAACILITAGVFYFKSPESPTSPNSNGVVKTDDKENDSIKKVKNPERILDNTMEELAYTTTVRKDTVLSPTSSLGFAATKKVNVIEIQYKDASLMLSKINDKIKEEIVISKKTGNDSIVNAFKTKLRSIQTQQGKYEFDGKQLILYSNPEKENILLLTTDSKTHFIKMGDFYYKLQMTKTPIFLNKISDPDIIDQLDKIVFDND
jgi:hypothetical protein